MAVFLVVTVVCGLLATGVKVNPTMIDFLPSDSLSTVAIAKMDGEFPDPVPNIRVMARDVTLTQAIELKRSMAAVEGVMDVTWLDDVIDIRTPLELADSATVESYYRDSNAIFSVTVQNGNSAAIDGLYDLIGDEGSLTGDALITYIGKAMTAGEVGRAIIIIVPLILLILLLTTSSWLEPLLFLMAIGVAVLINMGTNIFFGEVSFITNSVSPILQLAVSLDYAIFLLHAFADFRAEKDADGRPMEAFEAMAQAMRRSFLAISASAATTLFGFMALCFMRFGIGPNLGFNLVKGVALSFLAVTVFLPAFTMLVYKLIDKTRHRPILPSFKTAGSHILKGRKPILALVLLLVVPCFLGQGSSSFIFGLGGYQPGSRAAADEAAITEAFGTSTPMVVAVPRGDVVRELQLADELEGLEHVSSVISYANTVGAVIPADFLDEATVKRFYSPNLARIILYTNVADEGEASFKLVQQVRDKAASYYDESYVASMNTSIYDLKLVVTSDNQIVNWLAIIAISLVIMLAFRSISLPVLLVLTIETAIWINLSVPYFTNEPIQYIGYLVVSTVQLGATVDYAILFTERYLHLRRSMRPLEAAREAHAVTFQSIIVSATILSLSGLSLWMASSSPIVSLLGILLCRGTILSMILVCGFLPALLILCDRVVGPTTLRSGFFKPIKASHARLAGAAAAEPERKADK